MNEYTLDELMKEVYRRSLYNAEQSQKALDELYIENENNKKEITRLNNIIDELEKWCDIQFQVYKDLDKIQDSRISCQYLRVKEKLKELKEGK